MTNRKHKEAVVQKLWNSDQKMHDSDEKAMLYKERNTEELT